MASPLSYNCKAVILLLSCWIAAASAGVYPEDGPVLVLSEDKYKEVVEGFDTIWMLEYFQEDCGPCLQVSPEYTKAANSLKGIIKVAAVDCKATPMICGHMGIKTLPAIKLFPWEKKKNPYTGSFYKEAPATYEGPMPFTSKQIVEFAHGALPSQFVEVISFVDGSAQAFMSKKSKAPSVVLISNKDVVTPVFKALSLRFRGRLRFAQVPSTDDKMLQATGALTFPSLLVLKGNDYVKYEGAMKAEPIAEFLEGHALETSEEEESTDKEGAKDPKSAESAAKEDKNKLPVLNATDFETSVLKSEEAWLLAFINNGEECAEKRKAWEAAVTPVAGMVELAEVDTTADPEGLKLAERYNVKSQVEDPTKCVAVLLFEFGDDKADSEPQIYGGVMEGKALSAFVTEGLPDMFVHRLNKGTLSTFTGMEISKPKMVLVTAKTEVPGLFKALSTRFRTQMLFGMIHESEKELVQQFKAEKLPQIAVIMAVPSQTNPGQYEASVQNYQGPLKFNAIAYFIYQVLRATGGLKRSSELAEVTDDASFNELCVSRERLCAIGFFRGDSGSLDEQKAVLKEAGGAAGGESGPYVFMWVDVNKNDGFARQFDVLKGHAPTVAIISPAKLRTTVLRESYSKQSVMSFVSDLLSGRVTTSPIAKLPSFSAASADPEPEEPEEAAIVEEEFNLDDIMGEEIEDSGALGSKERRLEEVERELREAEEAKKKAEEEAAAKAAKKSKKKKKKSKKSKKDEL